MSFSLSVFVTYIKFILGEKSQNKKKLPRQLEKCTNIDIICKKI